MFRQDSLWLVLILIQIQNYIFFKSHPRLFVILVWRTNFAPPSYYDFSPSNSMNERNLKCQFRNFKVNPKLIQNLIRSYWIHQGELSSEDSKNSLRLYFGSGVRGQALSLKCYVKITTARFYNLVNDERVSKLIKKNSFNNPHATKLCY